ncbi:helix-turn-helix domain-containing protein [Amycolatopsis mediterranei]|uniref:helix-turn-helix domain-containing protein n=1 Tax=Amycolatopsis mediterranei TaxID=33910 RepID=UPI0002F16ACF|nr:helix-turn-helix domain-containing protein [Amycolatopsis mediterranei]
MYEEAAAPRALRDVAKCVWRSASEGPKRIVPDGCVDLVVGDGAAFVAGPDTTAWSSVTQPDAVLKGVRFRPGRAAAVLGVAADELRDRRVPVGELWGRSWAERLVEGEVSPVEAVAGRLGEVPPEDAAVAELIARLEAGVARVGDAAAGLVGSREAGRAARASPGHNSTQRLPEPAMSPRSPSPAGKHHRPSSATPSVGAGVEVVARVEDPALSGAVSARWLRRRFVQAVGYGPATYLRVSRFQRAVALAPHVSGLAALAAAAGYADQAHLSRDCRALTGLTPRAYFRGPSIVDTTARDRLRSA